jgi:hypothetical protein
MWEVRLLCSATRTQRHSVLLQLFALQAPFPRIRSDAVVVWKVRTGERPPRPEGCEPVGFSEKLWDAMQRGWAKTPEERPPLGEFYALPDGHESYPGVTPMDVITDLDAENTM